MEKIVLKSEKSTITTESLVESADRDCHRVLSRCVIIEAFPPQLLPPRPLLRPGPHLTAACLAAVQISVIYLQNIFIIDARTMLQTARFGVCIEYFYVQSNAVRTLCYIK